MQRLFLVLLVTASLGLAGCGVSSVPKQTAVISDSTIPVVTLEPLTSDFIPPSGEATNPPAASAGERRLLKATSTDGVTFTPTGEIFMNQANVSDMVVTADGTIYEYYIGQGIGKEPEWTAVAISTDNAKTWTYKYLVLSGWPTNRAPSDPDVVLLDDGTFRMYFVGEIGPKGDHQLGINYSTSTDGIHFTFGGTALKMSFSVVDSTTFYFNGLWHMYVFDDKDPWQYHATSVDGVTFTSNEQQYQFRNGKQSYFGNNPLIENGKLRMFGFSAPGQDIKSFTSTDGATWVVEDGSRLVWNPASLQGASYVQDLSVGKLADGSYLMFYVTDYPKK